MRRPITSRRQDRPTTPSEAVDIGVLNGIFEEWQDLTDEREDTSFPAALRSYYEEILEVLRDSDTDTELRQILELERDRIRSWLATFADMFHSEVTRLGESAYLKGTDVQPQ